MKFVTDPPVVDKIRKMKERVAWQHPLIIQKSIDQTSLVIDDERKEDPSFSFIVMGDSGAGSHSEHHPQREIAEKILNNIEDCRFILHTGDLVYQVGSREYYQKNFIQPYRELLKGGDHPQQINYDQMTFRWPFLPVLGNHDYYDLPFYASLVVQASVPLRLLMGLPIELNLGWEGSNQGEVYAKAFLDYLQQFSSQTKLLAHLNQHYTAKTQTGKALCYQPGRFTRLPNRYYQFSYGGIDFFALDSNTFNSPSPLPSDAIGDAYRHNLEKQLKELEQQELELWENKEKLGDTREEIGELEGQLEQIEEIKLDIEKQLNAEGTTIVDIEQLTWLKNRLIESWYNQQIRGRVIYFHHPPYVTEVNKCNQSQTIAVRRNLRWVLDEVAKEVKLPRQNYPLVDLVLNGHAHCLEYLQTENTGHADSYINWLICGGSGYSLRRQNPEAIELREIPQGIVARSHLFLGYSGYGNSVRRPYSAVRIEVSQGFPPKFLVKPLVRERYRGEWRDLEIQPFTISANHI